MQDTLRVATRIAHQLTMRGWTLGGAESCTGALVGHCITEVSGCSDFFMGGVISYSNEAKHQLLGVPLETIETHGAVSSQTAQAMAQGVRRLLGVDVGVAITGIAGPTGGTVDKPVGTVYVAVSAPGGDAIEHCHWGTDRHDNKQRSAMAALCLIETQIKVCPPGP